MQSTTLQSVLMIYVGTELDQRPRQRFATLAHGDDERRFAIMVHSVHRDTARYHSADTRDARTRRLHIGMQNTPATVSGDGPDTRRQGTTHQGRILALAIFVLPRPEPFPHGRSPSDYLSDDTSLLWPQGFQTGSPVGDTASSTLANNGSMMVNPGGTSNRANPAMTDIRRQNPQLQTG